MGISMNVPLLDLGSQHLPLQSQLFESFQKVLGHGRFILGPEVEVFEREMERYSHSPFAVSCANGSDALLLALMALDIGPGDEVVTTPYSFFATASCIARVGARAVFADICPHCYNVHPEAVLQKFTERTKAVIPVHLYGQMADMRPWLGEAQKRGISVIEDAAQAVGATLDGKSVGSFGHMATLSFFPSKNLGCLGDGGMILTRDEKLAARLKVLRVHGSEPKYYHSVLGINSRMDTIQAALLSVKLPHLDSYADARTRNAGFYEKEFVKSGLAEPALVHERCATIAHGENSSRGVPSGPIVLPAGRSTGRVHNQYIIRLKDLETRNRLKDHLSKCQVGSEIYYPVPLHLQKCFESWGYQQGDFPKSEAAAQTTLALPIYPELSEEQLAHVVASIRSFNW
jgi:dTDP-4-amino-4,6-dideoxygalactose transaminase